jgi:hypothetical protein
MIFKLTKQEFELVSQIAERVEATGPDLGWGGNRLDLIMDLEAVHSNGCDLDLAQLLAFPEPDFWHDIAGISQYVNRKTGGLEDCFMPRCAKPMQAKP